jgi:hypothetical protein
MSGSNNLLNEMYVVKLTARRENVRCLAVVVGCGWEKGGSDASGTLNHFDDVTCAAARRPRILDCRALPTLALPLSHIPSHSFQNTQASHTSNHLKTLKECAAFRSLHVRNCRL